MDNGNLLQHKNGIVGTIVFHAAVLMFFMFSYVSKPIEMPKEEGVEINFGTDENGLGPEEPAMGDAVVQPRGEAQPVQPQDKEKKLMTQDYEDAPVLSRKTNNNLKKITRTPEVKAVGSPTSTGAPVEKVNMKALYTGRNPNTSYTGGEGVTYGNGNQGRPDGSINSKNRVGGGSGNGGGTVSYNLSGRNPLHLPSPSYPSHSEGKVVVEVTVDRTGHVTYADPGKKGSTTLDASLLRAAKEAALISKFDVKNNAPAFQKGTITYHFHFSQQ